MRFWGLVWLVGIRLDSFCILCLRLGFWGDGFCMCITLYFLHCEVSLALELVGVRDSRPMDTRNTSCLGSSLYLCQLRLSMVTLYFPRPLYTLPTKPPTELLAPERGGDGNLVIVVVSGTLMAT